MTSLRWTLLILGGLFILGLLGWELRKRRARGGSVQAPASPHSRAAEAAAGRLPDADDTESHGSAREGRRTERHEPTFTMPDFPAREPVREPRVVEVFGREPAASGAPADGIVARAPVSGPVIGELPDVGRDQFETEDFDVHQHQHQHESAAGAADDVAPSEWTAEAGDAIDGGSMTGSGAAPAEHVRVVLDWPPEGERRIISVRVVPRPGERFSGAALRQALVGEGFVHGEFGIFHKPVGDGRIVMSAASLTRPGSFALQAMDTQHFAGLNLFAVLPGPVAPRDAVDRLCLVGRTLAQRLRGEVRDDRGAVLSDARVLELRQEALAGPPDLSESASASG
jgi:FtsZ-interacting cell division protein ZipA